MQFSPTIEEEWWDEHVEYAKFNRQRLDISSAVFHHPRPKAIVVLVTGLSDTFLKYSELIRSLYENGFSVFTYDHQSQGLSDRWLAERQSTWVHSFDDYVDDFVYFVTTIVIPPLPNLPLYAIAHSMGGLIVSIAMSRLPTLITRCVLTSPMFRSKCGMKFIGYRFPLPQPIAHWIAYLACFAGLGTMNAIGYFKEDSRDKLAINITTSDQSQLDNWSKLRLKYPEIMSTCVTNDWVVQCIRAQKRFSRFYDFIGTNTLILCADPDKEVFVYTRAMAMFINKSPNSRLFYAPKAHHEILFEVEDIRGAVKKTILNFLTQYSDSVDLVTPSTPLVVWEKNSPIFSPVESFIRTIGITLSIGGFLTGVILILSGGSKKR